MTGSVQKLIEQLNLSPHPEGGFFRETWRSAIELNLDGYPGARSAGTSILFLLPTGVRSAWHRVASDELWFWQGGDELELSVRPDRAGETHLVRLSATNPQALVPASWWQTAEASDGDCGYALSGCVVVPGFDFNDFEMDHSIQ